MIEPAALFDASEYRDQGLPRNLRERFIVPPFTVLDAAQGYWQERKREWLSLGIRSEVGRTARAFNIGLQGTAANGWQIEDDKGSGTSIFDPVLCELAYRWWSPEHGTVLDPFAGGSVRGVVAACMGREYWGVELSRDQIEANQHQALMMAGDDVIHPSRIPVWVHGDALTDLPEVEADMLFTCPPYGDLERYSDDPRDLSAMDPGAFAHAYRAVIGQAVARLRMDRFAVFVVGNYRDKSGRQIDLAGLTIQAFGEAGCDYYGDLALVTPVGTAAVRASASFAPGRKPIRRHQYVLVFVKGDWRRAAATAETFLESIDG